MLAQKTLAQYASFNVGVGLPPAFYDFELYEPTFTVGYERQILNDIIAEDMLRINPSVNIGHFSYKDIHSSETQRLNSLTIDTKLNLNVIQFNNITFVISAGAFYGRRRAKANEPSDDINIFEPAKTYENFASLYGYGVRYITYESKLAFRLMLTKYVDTFEEQQLRFVVEIKL